MKAKLIKRKIKFEPMQIKITFETKDELIKGHKGLGKAHGLTELYKLLGEILRELD